MLFKLNPFQGFMHDFWFAISRRLPPSCMRRVEFCLSMVIETVLFADLISSIASFIAGSQCLMTPCVFYSSKLLRDDTGSRLFLKTCKFFFL